MKQLPPPVPRHTAWSELSSGLPAWSFCLVVASITFGALLRLLQFTADTSLWLDELALANNIAERSVGSLLREPLGYAQVAPPGFLVVEKTMWLLFGANDHALRLYSFVAGIGSLFAISLVGFRLGLRESAWLAPLLLALSGSFIFQSAQVKPYSGDLLITLLLIAAALYLTSSMDAKRVWPATLGVLAPWFSFPAALTLAAIGAVLLFSKQRRRCMPIVAVWAVSTLAAVLYATSLVHADTAASMQTFWSRVAGFPPALASLVPWSLAKLRAHLWSDVGLRGVTLWLGVVGVGAFCLWRRKRIGLAFVASPIVAAVGAAALHRYPFGDRVSHWAGALLILLIAAAATEASRVLANKRLAGLSAVPGLCVAALPVLTFAGAPPPYSIDNVKPVLAEIARQRQPNDWLFVYPGAWHAYRYYGARAGISPDRVVFGHCPKTSLRESLASLDPVRGNARVWVLFAHVVLPADRTLLLEYLDRVGERRESLTLPDPYVSSSTAVDAHLYDLSDATRLRTAEWRTYPISHAWQPNDLSACMFGMVPLGSKASDVRTAER